jgi:hypothetical protein
MPRPQRVTKWRARFNMHHLLKFAVPSRVGPAHTLKSRLVHRMHGQAPKSMVVVQGREDENKVQSGERVRVSHVTGWHRTTSVETVLHHHIGKKNHDEGAAQRNAEERKEESAFLLLVSHLWWSLVRRLGRER